MKSLPVAFRLLMALSLCFIYATTFSVPCSAYVMYYRDDRARQLHDDWNYWQSEYRFFQETEVGWTLGQRKAKMKEAQTMIN